MTEYADVPEAIVRHVRVVCAHLPEAYEEQAFAGVRWRIRGRTVAHVVAIDDGRDIRTVLWTQVASDELSALLAVGDPYSPGWDDGLVTVALRDDGTTDWSQVKELVTDSYSLLAPKKLIARLDNPRSDC